MQRSIGVVPDESSAPIALNLSEVLSEDSHIDVGGDALTRLVEVVPDAVSDAGSGGVRAKELYVSLTSEFSL